MSQVTWDLIKENKRFYVNSYRAVGAILIFSVLLNLFLSIMGIYLFLTEPEGDYYATYGGTAPIQLAPMSVPNESSVPLLQEESIVTYTKEIPQ